MMNQDDCMKLAREKGAMVGPIVEHLSISKYNFLDFCQALQDEVREECAKVCEAYDPAGRESLPKYIAAAIRALIEIHRLEDRIRELETEMRYAWNCLDGALGKELDRTGQLSQAVMELVYQRDALRQQPVDVGPEWTPCVKLPVVVHVREQRLGETHVSTREGITPVKPDDLIMMGVQGEEYPIGRELFERTYRLGNSPAPFTAPEGWQLVPKEPTPAMLYEITPASCTRDQWRTNYYDMLAAAPKPGDK